MKHDFKILIYLAIFILGVAAGHYHGKAYVYEKIYAQGQHLTVSPVAMEKIGG